MTSGQTVLFPDWVTILWTLVNLIMLVAVITGSVLGIRYMLRLSRRVKRLEERLNKSDE